MVFTLKTTYYHWAGGGEEKKWPENEWVRGFGLSGFLPPHLSLQARCVPKEGNIPSSLPHLSQKVCMTQCCFCRRLALDASTTKPPNASLLIRQSNVKLMDSHSCNGPNPLACNTHVQGKHCSPHRAEVTLNYLPKSKSGQGFWQSYEESPQTLHFPGKTLWIQGSQQYPQLNATGNNIQNCPMSMCH